MAFWSNTAQASLLGWSRVAFDLSWMGVPLSFTKRMPSSLTSAATVWIVASEITAPLLATWPRLLALMAVRSPQAAPTSLAARMPSPMAETAPVWGSPQKSAASSVIML